MTHTEIIRQNMPIIKALVWEEIERQGIKPKDISARDIEVFCRRVIFEDHWFIMWYGHHTNTHVESIVHDGIENRQ